MAPLRLHANLLFYGLDEGTWSDPPGTSIGRPLAAGVEPHNAMPTESGEVLVLQRTPPAGAGELAALASIKAFWGEAGGGGGGCGGHGSCPGGCSAGVAGAKAGASHAVMPTELSTDEGSEPKGSESDSLPDSSEGYIMPSMGLQQPYDGSQAVAAVHAAAGLAYMQSHEAAAVYSTYLPPEGFLAAHGFGGGGETAGPSPYPYEGYSVTAAATAATGVPSIGSYAHLSGQCSRCCFHPKGRCTNGYSCQFCHFDHDKRPRNGKKKRYRRQSDEAGEANGEE